MLTVMGMSRVDVYTKEPIKTRSEEHVVHNFLGGRLLCPDIIDKETNDKFGASIDAKLHRSWHPILVMLDARSDRKPNAQPAPFKGVPGLGGETFDVEAGGRITTPPKLSLRVEGNQVTVDGTFPSEKLARREIRRQAKERGLSEDVIQKLFAMVKPIRDEATEVEVPIDIFSEDALRAVCKMACNLLAHHDGASFLSDGFDDVREYVLGASDAVLVQFSSLPASQESLGDMDHLVLVAPREGRTQGFVSLFGSVGFAIDMGPACGTERYSYRVDQIGRTERVNHSLDLSMDVEGFCAADKRNAKDIYDLMCRQVTTLWQKTVGRRQQLQIRRAIKESFEEVGLRPGESIEGADNAARLAALVMQKLEPELAARMLRRVNKRC